MLEYWKRKREIMAWDDGKRPSEAGYLISALRLSRAEWERENKKERDYLISPRLLPLPKSSR